MKIMINVAPYGVGLRTVTPEGGINQVSSKSTKGQGRFFSR